jgi:hypothetical protein
MNEPARPANWYADPTGRHQYRYWNGTEWTDQVADNQVTSTDPPTMTPADVPVSSPAAAPSRPPAPGAPPVAPRLNQPNPRPNSAPLGPVVALAGALALAVGSFLDSASASGTGVFAFTVEESYMDGDGPFTLGAGIIVGVLAILLLTRVLPRWGGWLVAFFGAAGALTAVADIVDVTSNTEEIEALGATISVGPALWVCLAGGVIALAGGTLAALLTASDS